MALLHDFLVRVVFELLSKRTRARQTIAADRSLAFLFLDRSALIFASTLSAGLRLVASASSNVVCRRDSFATFFLVGVDLNALHAFMARHFARNN